MMFKPKRIGTLLLATVMLCTVVGMAPAYAAYQSGVAAFTYKGYNIPKYDGDSYEAVHSNDPTFTDAEKASGKTAFERYSNLDSEGRCGVAYASLNKSLMPTYSRGSISAIYPSGWIQAKYSLIPSSWLYNRCHLIGFQLTGVDNVNAKKAYCQKDLITGTRFLNVGDSATGMVGFENKVASYVRTRTSNHVLYRVIPVFQGNNEVASGVIMEGESIEDEAINFCVFCYNVQPGISIDYATGASKLTGSVATKPSTPKWSKVKAKKKSVYVRWKKCSGASGYQIAFRKMGPNKHKYIKTKKTSRTIKRLKSKKYHQVKVRAYKKSGGKTYYSGWSKVKKVKVK
ncbi:MAG: DNA/RNA non-specific endonuclease [Eubacteriaceae bacterium]|nr:DNA/RNA non-specific endonuclease [Eubacteriaceae bacterium]